MDMLRREQDVVTKRIVEYHREMINSIYKEVRQNAIKEVEKDEYRTPIHGGYHGECRSVCSEYRSSVQTVKTERPDYSNVFMTLKGE